MAQALPSTESVRPLAGAAAVAVPEPDLGDAPAAAAGAAPDARRRIERVAPGAVTGRGPRSGRMPASAAAMFQPLDSDDAAIPFDRVPYVPSDLRRVAIMAGLMVVLIIIAALIVSHVVT